MLSAISGTVENLFYGGVGFVAGSITTYLVLKTQGYHIRWLLRQRSRGSRCEGTP